MHLSLTGAVNSRGVYTTPFFAAAEDAQTISPTFPVVAINSAQTFTTNLPAIWTASAGAIVAAADGLSATFTAPSTAQSVTITATNENDPGDTATTSAIVTVLGISGVYSVNIGYSGAGGNRKIVNI